MRRVIVESPCAGDVTKNIFYAHNACRDCLDRGESPLASHLFFTQFLDDTKPLDRQIGINAGLAWLTGAEAQIFYVDNGWSKGMLNAWKVGHGIIKQEIRAFSKSADLSPPNI